jgi:hypothetical protein
MGRETALPSGPATRDEASFRLRRVQPAFAGLLPHEDRKGEAASAAAHDTVARQRAPIE